MVYYFKLNRMDLYVVRANPPLESQRSLVTSHAIVTVVNSSPFSYSCRYVHLHNFDRRSATEARLHLISVSVTLVAAVSDTFGRGEHVVSFTTIHTHTACRSHLSVVMATLIACQSFSCPVTVVVDAPSCFVHICFSH